MHPSGEAARQIRKVLAGLNSQKGTLPEAQETKTSEAVTKAVSQVTTKMEQAKLPELKPPYFPKTLSKFRMDGFTPLKKTLQPLLDSKNPAEFQKGIAILRQFVQGLDTEYFDLYMEQVRGNYVRKIFQENYEFDEIDFKEMSTKYKLRNQVDILLNTASQWLIQIEATQDLFERIELYFAIRVPAIIEKSKKTGNQEKNGGWFCSLLGTIGKAYSLMLRKASKGFQTTLFSAIAPAATLLTFAIVGGVGNGMTSLPWKSSANNIKAMFAPIIAVAVPYCLQNLADSVEKKVFSNTLSTWSGEFERIADSIRKFNCELEVSIRACYQANSSLEFQKERTNLEKFVEAIKTNLHNLNEFDEEKFDQMRERTEAYFQAYTEIVEEGWITVVPSKEAINQAVSVDQLEEPMSTSMMKGFMGVAKEFTKLKNTHELLEMGRLK